MLRSILAKPRRLEFVGKVVDKIGAQDFDPGQLLGHLIEAVRQFPELPRMFYVELRVKTAFCYIVDSLNDRMDRTQREMAQQKGQ